MKTKLYVFSLLILFLASSVAAQTCTIPPSNMISWWRAEGNPQDSQDSNHGALQNGATFATGKVGQAFSLDGVDDFVRVPDAANLQASANTGISFGAWVNPAISGENGYVIDKLGGLGQGYAVALFNGAVTAFAGNSGCTNNGPTVVGPVLSKNQWAFVFVTMSPGNPSTLKLYVNGNLVAMGSNQFHCATVGDFQIGKPLSFQNMFQGLIDEVQFFNRELTAVEIHAEFNAGSSGKCLQCGNGIVQGTEACDDGNTFSGDGCSSTCNVENGYTCTGQPSICTPTQTCGNNIKEGTEQCDGTSLDGATCATATGGSQPLGTLGCTNTCTFDISGCFSDGDSDGIPDPQDQCPGSTPDNIIPLNPNQYAQNNLLTSAFESGPKPDQSLVYTMQTAHGCTCKQIVAALGIGQGQIRKGCSPSVMEQFTGVSANPDRQSGVGRQTTGSAVREGEREAESPAIWLGPISILSIAALAAVSLYTMNTLNSRRRR